MRNAFLAVLLALIFLAPTVLLARTPNDSMFGDQWYLSKIHAETAWDTATGSRNVVVAVLDTGVDIEHEDIASNIWVNTDEIADNNVDDDGNGYVDDVYGWDFVEDDNMPSPEHAVYVSDDVLSHGTLIAGVIGAIGNNAIGVSGVNWKVRVMAVRMLNEEGSGGEGDAADAIRYAIANGADVINLSFAGNNTHSELSDAIEEAYEAGVVVVAALGNDGRDTDSDPVYPACLRSGAEDWVIGVSATDESDHGTSFTNYGKKCADIAAPGESILGLGFGGDSYSGPWDGTSAASPLVAGAAALLLSEYPSLTPEDVRNVLKLSVDPVVSLGYTTGALGAGRLNIARALELAAAYSADDSSDEVEVVEENIPPSPATSKATGDLALSYVAFGAPSGALPNVAVHRADGTEYARFAAYAPNFRGGVNVDLMDQDQNGIPEVVTGAGKSGGPHVRIFLAYGALKDEFFAYDPSSGEGVDVATGDIDADGEIDIVTSVGANVSRDIVVWSERGEEKMRFTASVFDPAAALSVTTADVDGDWEREIVVSSSSQVAVYDHDGTYLVSFSPYANGEISVAALDVNGDYIDDLVVTSLGATHDVRVFTKIGALRGTFQGSLAANSVGQRVAGVDVDLDGDDEVLLMEDKDGGIVRILSSDGSTSYASWTAPSLGGTAGPFFAAW